MTGVEHLASAITELDLAATTNFPPQRVSRLLAAYGEALCAFYRAEEDGDPELAEQAAEIVSAAEDGARWLCAAQIPTDAKHGGPARIPNPDAAARGVLRQIEQI